MDNKFLKIATAKKTYIIISAILFIIFCFISYFYTESKTELNRAYELLLKNNINTDSLFGVEEVKETTTPINNIQSAKGEAKRGRELKEVINEYIKIRYTYNGKSKVEDNLKAIQGFVTNQLYDQTIKNEIINSSTYYVKENNNFGSLDFAYFKDLDTSNPKAFIQIIQKNINYYNKKKYENNCKNTEYLIFYKENGSWKISDIKLDKYQIGEK